MFSEKDVSLSEVYPIVCRLLRKKLKVLDSDGNDIRKAKELISDELEGRYQPSDIKTASSTLVMASLMDPRYKRVSFLSSAQRKKPKNPLTDLLMKCHWRN